MPLSALIPAPVNTTSFGFIVFGSRNASRPPAGKSQHHVRMRRILFLLLPWLISSVPVLSQSISRELIICGRERVHILDLNRRDANGTPKIIWTWQAAGRADLPKDYHPLFRSTDECKPIDGGRRILITSSGGGVALVDREKDAVLFYGRAVNAHSADVLPGGRIAVAASRDPRENKGDALILFDITMPGRELWRTDLPSGHGVVWDEKRAVVWALADQEIRGYRLADWKTPAPKLEKIAVIPLSERGGHELHPVPRTSRLAVSTATKCWLFDRDAKPFLPTRSSGKNPRSSVSAYTRQPDKSRSSKPTGRIGGRRKFVSLIRRRHTPSPASNSTRCAGMHEESEFVPICAWRFAVKPQTKSAKYQGRTFPSTLSSIVFPVIAPIVVFNIATVLPCSVSQ
jgi:hypothetical protein